MHVSKQTDSARLVGSQSQSASSTLPKAEKVIGVMNVRPANPPEKRHGIMPILNGHERSRRKRMSSRKVSRDFIPKNAESIFGNWRNNPGRSIRTWLFSNTVATNVPVAARPNDYSSHWTISTMMVICAGNMEMNLAVLLNSITGFISMATLKASKCFA